MNKKTKSKREAARERARAREYANRSYMNRLHRMQVHTEVLQNVCFAVENQLAVYEARIEDKEPHAQMLMSMYCGLAGFLEDAQAKMKSAGCEITEESERWVTHVSPRIAELMEENAKHRAAMEAETRAWEHEQARSLKLVED